MRRPIETWRAIASEPSFGFDVLRMYLGAALFVRGALFVADPNRVLQFVDRADWFVPLFLAHYVAAAHLCGGILLALGLATRIAAAAQVPILAGAVFVVHWRDGLLAEGQSLELAGIVLVMLAVYSVFGAGPLSADQQLRRGPGATLAETIRRARTRIRRHHTTVATGDA